ncbi:putative gustatory receptor 22c [Drosophila simulans]|uniref:Gustatory receptor n=1 Tax=Drosophila simulans TaxID=7240 RepID=B4Q7J1_DROSI|nr:putative gustatory receptor 22c [Drosophila simulans]EDX03371.1 GD23115 [Drosophila simulans]KMY87523.1 uncharacterized protein Dsimw501_GD23115 [Drosophila simulans]
MFASRSDLQSRLCWIILKATLYSSWLLGVFPYRFDSRNGQLKRSRFLLFYGLIVNFFLLLKMVCSGGQKQGSPEAFARNPVLENTHYTTGMVTIFSCLVIHFLNFWGSTRVQDLANELLGLEYQHFASLNETSCPKFNCLVIQKSASVIGLSMSYLSVAYGLPGNNFSVEMVVVNSLVQFSINCNIMHYYIGALLIYRYIWLINRQLLEVVTTLKLDRSVDSSRIRKSLSLYRRLLELKGNIVAAYEYHITLVLTTGLACNILAIYSWIVLDISMNIRSISLLIFPLFLFVNVWNLWLSIVAFDLAENAGKNTQAVLRLFADLEMKNIELERSVNEFALLCSHRQFNFHVCGLFTINYKMGFQMIITSFLYLIYLIQFDFMNL